MIGDSNELVRSKVPRMQINQDLLRSMKKYIEEEY
jgi:hypothetical protein